MNFMIGVFFYIVFVAVIILSDSGRVLLPSMEQDEIDDQIESIRIDRSVWQDFTLAEIRRILAGLLLLSIAVFLIMRVFKAL